MSSSVDVKNVVKSVQKFDGMSNVETFCSRLETAVTTFKLKPEWVLLNFHLFIDGEVTDWWKWAQQIPLKGLNSENATERFDAVKESLKSYYEPESIKKEAKRAMKALKFLNCKSAGEYVSKKLSYFSLMDPDMTDEKQVDKLIKGLPEQLRNIMYGSRPENHTEFLQRLRRMDVSGLAQSRNGNSHKKYGGGGSKEKFGGSKDSSSEGQSFAKTKGFDSEGRRVCYKCSKPGHIAKDCTSKSSETKDKSPKLYELEAGDEEQDLNC